MMFIAVGDVFLGGIMFNGIGDVLYGITLDAIGDLLGVLLGVLMNMAEP